ncbi:ribonuclease H protein [Tanacetum coccineum]
MRANSANRISLSQKSPTNVDSCPLQAPKIGDTTLQVVVEDTNRSVSAKTTTPLSMVSDKLVWHYEAKGRYTMKSGYYHHPQIKAFRMNCGILKLCQDVETVEHMLFECPWTKHGSIISCVQALLETIHSKSERMKLHTSLANITWQIWKSRNGKVFNACQLCPPHMILSVNSMVSDFNSVFSTSYPTSSALVNHDVPQESSLRWIPPPTNNCVKLNCEASYKPYKAALGVIARDSTGSILLCSGEIWCVSDPLMAEILAIRSACHLAISQGWQNATIKSDSKLVVSFASSEADPPWAVAATVDDIKLWASQLALSFSWVHRDCNLVAHHVAQVAFSSHVNFVWDVTFPVEITSIARSDI